jgi:hypothetical protein
MLSDSISLLGYGFYNLSMKRRNDLKSCLNPGFRKICSSDTPVTEQLFGDNCSTKLKDMGDMSKHSLSSFKGQGYNNNYKNKSNSLNFRGAVGQGYQQQNQSQGYQGYQGYQQYRPRGGRQNYKRGGYAPNQYRGQKKGFQNQ